MSWLRRWGTATFILVCGVAFAGATAASGEVLIGLVVGVLLVIMAVLLSPLIFPAGTTWAQARERSTTTGAPVILWKPNCTWCIRLRLALGPAGRRAIWVDIERDADARAATRVLNEGNETTPTVIARDATRTNPEPSWVRERLPLR